MAKTNPNDNIYLDNLTGKQKLASALYLMQEPVAKLSSPYAGTSAIIGNDTMDYHSATPRLYNGLTPNQMYSMLGLGGSQGNNNRLSNDELSGTSGSLSELLSKFQGQPDKIAKVLSSIFNINSKDYDYASGQTGGFDMGGTRIG